MTQVLSLLLLVHDALVDWLAHGLWDSSWWQILIYALLTTHVTIAAVTIYLHRSQAHLALELHRYVAHFFRAWLWLTTGMITKEWVAIHRKHHAKCETVDDPHSPVIYGIKTVLREGTELYRNGVRRMKENKVTERGGTVELTELERFSHLTPDDWVERNVYSRYPWQGVGLLLILDPALFGAIGMTVWAFQMAWIPVMAAGIINGLGHWWGYRWSYRNFPQTKTNNSTNISPWGIVIGGEELHNNHHAYPSSAKLSVKRWEFDIGWLYIRLLEKAGLAVVNTKRLAPQE